MDDDDDDLLSLKVPYFVFSIGDLQQAINGFRIDIFTRSKMC